VRSALLTQGFSSQRFNGGAGVHVDFLSRELSLAGRSYRLSAGVADASRGPRPHPRALAGAFPGRRQPALATRSIDLSMAARSRPRPRAHQHLMRTWAGHLAKLPLRHPHVSPRTRWSRLGRGRSSRASRRLRGVALGRADRAGVRRRDHRGELRMRRRRCSPATPGWTRPRAVVPNGITRPSTPRTDYRSVWHERGIDP